MAYGSRVEQMMPGQFAYVFPSTLDRTRYALQGKVLEKPGKDDEKASYRWYQRVQSR